MKKTHGLSKTREFTIWISMKERCYNTNHQNYKYYGGKGVTVCKQWLGSNGFITFLKDMGNSPTSKHSLDRINGDLDYYKENCKWSTTKEQNRNRISNVNIFWNNKSQCITDWSKELFPYKSKNFLHSRLYKLNWSIEKAFTTLPFK